MLASAANQKDVYIFLVRRSTHSARRIERDLLFLVKTRDWVVRFLHIEFFMSASDQARSGHGYGSADKLAAAPTQPCAEGHAMVACTLTYRAVYPH